jgi:hypothetical protein
MLAQGVPAPEVSRILGHASVDITYRLYAHAVPQARQQALDAMERFLQGIVGARCEITRSILSTGFTSITLEGACKTHGYFPMHWPINLRLLRT